MLCSLHYKIRFINIINLHAFPLCSTANVSQVFGQSTVTPNMAALVSPAFQIKEPIVSLHIGWTNLKD